MEINKRSSTLAHRRLNLVTKNKNWKDAKHYCHLTYSNSLFAIDSMSDYVLLKAYLTPLLGQLACRLIFVF